MKRELVALLLLSYGCLVTVYVMWLFLTVTWVGLQSVIVIFPDYTRLLFYLVAEAFKNTHYIHCIYMYFTPDCKYILQSYEGMMYFLKQRANKHEWHNA